MTVQENLHFINTNTMLRISDYRNMKNIERLNLVPILRSYNLLEHSYMVTVLFMYFSEFEGISCDYAVLKRILHHDVLETITGDLSYVVKNHNRITKNAWENIEQEMIKTNIRFAGHTDLEIELSFTEEQEQLFKACDLLELWIFIKEEIALGNRMKEILTIERRCVALLIGKFKSIDEFINTYKC